MLKCIVKLRNRAQQSLAEESASSMLLAINCQMGLDQFHLFAEVSRRLLASEHPEALLPELCELLRTHLDCSVCFTHLLDEQSNRLELRAAAGLNSNDAGALRRVTPDDLLLQHPLDQQSRRFQSIRATNSLVARLASLGVQAYACAAVFTRKQFAGSIAFGSSRPDAFDSADLELMQSVADHLGAALERAEAIRAREESERRFQALETAVRQRTRQLQETIAELESFSYSIAHDMRAPLRAMQGYGKVLLTEFTAGLDPAGREYLRRIVVSSQRMDALIHDVLNYSQIARGELPLERVELQPFIRDILLSYPDFRASRADIRMLGEFPAVSANRAALTQVVSNLLGNAVKFVAPGVQPVVQVSAAAQDGHVVLSVRDNGVGIEPESHQRIFQIFQKLHRQEEYEGTGIGLAIVRKAIERMGGQVAVSSAPGAGSTFHITLKAADPP